MKAGTYAQSAENTRQAAVVLAKAVAVALALTVAAKLRFYVPWSPVPVTLQTFVVLTAGATLGVGAGAGGVALYAALASVGLPVLAGPSIFGPTGGYVLGFVGAAALVSAAARARPWGLLAAMVAAEVLVLLCGGVWLAAWMGQSAAAAWKLGVVPFVVGDSAKLAAAWAVATWYNSRAGTRCR